MKLAIAGTRGIEVNISSYHLPEGVTEIVSGGAKGVDLSARKYAEKSGIPYREFLPDYKSYGRRAPLLRNQQIAEYADSLVAFWDEKSRGTLHTITLFQKLNKPVTVIMLE